jgi:predicted alpha/beta-hydrolase family hydrolase
MRGHVILSHGSDSGPDATKVSLLAGVAESLGWSTERPDYRDCDAGGYAAAVPCRVARLRERIEASARPPVLVGSSMGAFVSGLASLQSPCAALFLMALPVTIPGVASTFDMDRSVPAMLMHGFADELCPADAAMAFAAEARMPTMLLADGHRLADHVDVLATQFQLFMESLSA